RRGDHRVRVRRALAAELHHEAPHARILGREAVLIDEVLPDRHGVATAAESQLDELAVRRAGTRGRGPVARRRPRRELRKAWRARPGVGGHLTGRFWWRPPAAGRADRDSGGLEIAARRLATNAGRLFDAAERPAQPPQSENLLPLVIPQDVGHSGGEPCAPPPRQRLGTALLHWPVFRCPRLAGFGCPPRRTRRDFSAVDRVDHESASAPGPAGSRSRRRAPVGTSRRPRRPRPCPWPR